jgi:alpha-tubulin suppressor-like RCC1 family protein
MRHTRFLFPVFAGLFLVVLGCGEDSPPPLTAPESGADLSAAAAAAPLSFSRITVGQQHTCATTFANQVYCWGRNDRGQLGIGTTGISQRSLPTPAGGTLRFVQISAGMDHTCGVTSASTAYCWGNNSNGQLGDGTRGTRTAPVPVAGGRQFRQIIAGALHTCGVTPANQAFCWGSDLYGQVGDGAAGAGDHLLPAKVWGSQSWKRVIAGGNHTCGVTNSNKAFCWGRNSWGQLGTNSFTNRTTPTAVSGGFSFTQVIAGANHTCALTGEQKAYCWGDNQLGGIGDGGELNSRLSPSPVVGTRRWRQVIPGYLHTCGVTMANVAFCWGFNFAGQNGDGTTTSRSVPTRVAGGHAFEAISTGLQESPTVNVRSDAAHSCALNTDDKAYCWGENTSGQLGNGIISTRSLVPVAVVGPM